MRKIACYTLIEVMVVCAVLMILGSMIFVTFHKQHKGLVQTAQRDITSAEIHHIRHRLCLAATAAAGPLNIQAGKVTSGEQTVAILNGNQLELFCPERTYKVRIPAPLIPTLTLEDDNRLLVLTLKGQSNSFRIAAAATPERK